MIVPLLKEAEIELRFKARLNKEIAEEFEHLSGKRYRSERSMKDMPEFNFNIKKRGSQNRKKFTKADKRQLRAISLDFLGG